MRNPLDNVYFCCVCTLVWLAEGASPTDGGFHESPRDTVVTAGQDVTLTCRIRHDTDKHVVLWNVQKPGETKKVIGRKQWPGKGKISSRFPSFLWVNYQPNETVRADHYWIYDLQIKKTIIEDSGNYSCVSQGGKFPDSKTAHLEVLPRGIKKVTVNERDSVRIACRILNEKAWLVWWTISKKNGHHKLKPIQQSPRNRPTAYSNRVTYDWESSEINNYDLIISNVQKSDRGVYRCVMTPNETIVERRLQVLCDGDPVFHRPPHDTYASFLKHVTLRCGVHARRSGNVIARWWKKSIDGGTQTRFFPFKHNDTMLHGSFMWASKSDRGNFDLIIIFAQMSDAGFYTCEAWPENYDQFDTAATSVATLRVFAEPSIGQYNIPTLQTTAESNRTGQQAHFVCIPRHKAIWLDENLNVLTDGTERQIADQRFEISSVYPDALLIKNVQPKDAQKYYCVLPGDRFVWQKTVQLVVIGCSESNDFTWHFNGYNCYGAPKSETSFGMAEIMCRSANAHLARPKTTFDTNELREMSRKIWRRERKLWIGLDNIEWEKEWKWTDGRVLTEKEHFWSSGQPDNRGGYENCGLMDEAREFRDEECMKSNAFICESPGIHWNSLRLKEKQHRCPVGWIAFDCGELCYWMPDEKMDWARGRDACERKSGSIVLMRNERQWRAVQLMLKPGTSSWNQEAWIGLRKTGMLNGIETLEWVDGTPAYWTNRRRGERYVDGDCISIDWKGRINTRHCSDKKFVVCQKQQGSLRNNDWYISLCGKAKHSKTDIPNKRDVGPAPDSRRKGTINKMNIAAIFDGNEIAIEYSPWAVRIVTGGKVVCSGVLIGPKTVLTSGHCVLHKRNRPMSSRDVFVGLGSENRSPTSGRLEAVQMVKVHRDYTEDHFDIAVIELKRRQLHDCWNVRPVCLPKKNYDFSGFKCKLVSWGYDGPLKYCDMEFDKFKYRESTGMVYYSKTSHCRLGQSDFGAPLFCRNATAIDPTWTLVALYSDNFGRYAEFTNVHDYLTWIYDKMQLNDLPENEFYYELACFQGQVDIACDQGRPPIISVYSATYGAHNKARCAYQTSKRVDCGSDVSETVRDRCAGKNRCRFQITTELFGDPCPHNFEYLELVYQCVNTLTWGLYQLHDTICNDGEKIELSCGQGNPLQIKVRLATFSFASQRECPNARQGHPTCSTRDVKHEIANRCDGKVFCSYSVTFKNWGDPCPGYTKKLKVGYSCVKKSGHGGHRYAAHAAAGNCHLASSLLAMVICVCLVFRA